MFGISLPELIVIVVIALIVFGPEKLPELARTLGGISGQLRRQSDTLRREFYNSVYRPSEEFKTRMTQEARNLVSVEPPVQKKPTEPTAESGAAIKKADDIPPHEQKDTP